MLDIERLEECGGNDTSELVEVLRANRADDTVIDFLEAIPLLLSEIKTLKEEKEKMMQENTKLAKILKGIVEKDVDAYKKAEMALKKKEDLEYLQEMSDVIHDCFYDIYLLVPSNQQIMDISNCLPDDIKSDAQRWGWRDTEIGNKTYRWIKNNYLSSNNIT